MLLSPLTLMHLQAPNWGVPLPDIMGMKNRVSLGHANSKYVPRLQSLMGIDEMLEDLGEPYFCFGLCLHHICHS